MTQTPTTLSKVITTYQKRGHRRWSGDPLDPADVRMLVRLSTWPEAPSAFAALELAESKGLWLGDDCVTAHRYDTGEHEAQVERLRREPNYKKLQAKLESLAKEYGMLPEHVRESFDVIRVDLYYRQRDHE
jgi:hypothetical protein